VEELQQGLVEENLFTQRFVDENLKQQSEAFLCNNENPADGRFSMRGNRKANARIIEILQLFEKSEGRRRNYRLRRRAI